MTKESYSNDEKALINYCIDQYYWRSCFRCKYHETKCKDFTSKYGAIPKNYKQIGE